MGDLGPIPGLVRSPGKRKVYSLRYTGLENSMDWTVSKSRKRLSDCYTFIYRGQGSLPQPGPQALWGVHECEVKGWSWPTGNWPGGDADREASFRGVVPCEGWETGRVLWPLWTPIWTNGWLRGPRPVRGPQGKENVPQKASKGGFSVLSIHPVKTAGNVRVSKQESAGRSLACSAAEATHPSGSNAFAKTQHKNWLLLSCLTVASLQAKG